MKTTFIACLSFSFLGMHESPAQTTATPIAHSDPENEAEVAALIKALADPAAHGLAVLGLRAKGTRGKAAIPALIALLQLDEVSDQIYKALAAMGPEALPPLIAKLKDKDSRVRARAAGALQYFGPLFGGDGYRHRPGEPIWVKSAVPALITALTDENLSVRLMAADSLGAIGSDAKDAVPALIEAIKDHALRRTAVTALSTIGTDASQAVPAIAEMLKDKSVDARLIAVDALGQIGGENEATVPALLSALNDDAVAVRSRTVFALGQLGSNARSASSALVEAMKDEDLCDEATVALRRIGADASTVPALIELLKHKTPRSRQLTAKVLSYIGTDAKDAVPALIQSLQDEHTRQFAIHALGRIGSEAKAAVPALTQLLKNEVYYIRAGAAEALGRIGSDAKSSVAELVKALNDDNPQVRRFAAEALKKIDPDAQQKAVVR